MCNVICSYNWSQGIVVEDPWMVRDAFYSSQITAPADGGAMQQNNKYSNDYDEEDEMSEQQQQQPLKDKHCRKNGKYTHVPHKDKPPQVVAKRNARERRRVQAVNGAFIRLRKAVPFENNRGKRVSKVKTLQNAIDYIYNLQDLLHKDGSFEPLNIITNYCYTSNRNIMEEMVYEDIDY